MVAPRKKNARTLKAEALQGGITGGTDYYRIIADAVPGLLWVCTPDGLCHYVSQGWLDYTGLKFQEAAQSGTASLIHPEDGTVGKRAWTRALKRGRGYQAELRLKRHDGNYRWHRLHGIPDLTGGKKLKRWVVIGIDIEELKGLRTRASELQEAQNRAKADLERTVAERTKQLEQVVEQFEAFAYSIAHDMRAPLRTMHQYAETISRDFGSQIPDEAQFYLDKIMAAAQKLDSLIRDVLAYNRVSQSSMTLQPINLEHLLSEVLLMNPALSPPHLALKIQLPLQPVIGDHTALMQVFSNLLTNAVKFVAEGRDPAVKIWTETTGERVRIFIQDNGIGIAEKDRERIFKMFERLQPESRFEGSGIGLTIVRRAVERMGGMVGIQAPSGEGSVFWVELEKGELC